MLPRDGGGLLARARLASVGVRMCRCADKVDSKLDRWSDSRESLPAKLLWYCDAKPFSCPGRQKGLEKAGPGAPVSAVSWSVPAY